MYKKFFGFRERPFKLVPDPAYLYLGRSHEDALGHLNYAVHQGDGFVVITGEVGTGKTTICRMFLEKISDHTETAYIFNPKLDSLQLLKAINDEFCIDSSSNNTKDLIDILNRFLIDKKQENKRVILIVDESQNLSIEVLEQLRLLSNLETTKAKLLQIILVGQPELGEKLDSFELRQLEQRITLSCHLNPLTFRETEEYINHRIHVASYKGMDLFTRSAVNAVYRYSGGVPRLINISCDRALLRAYSLDRRKVTRQIVLDAIRELNGKGAPAAGFTGMPRKSVFLVCILVLVNLILGLVILNPPVFFQESDANTGGAEPAVHKIAAPPVVHKPALETNLSDNRQPRFDGSPEEAPQTMGASPIDGYPLQTFSQAAFATWLEQLNPRISRKESMMMILQLWQRPVAEDQWPDSIENDTAFLVLAAKQNQLDLLRIRGDLSLAMRLNHPAIMEIRKTEDSAPVFLALVGAESGQLIFAASGKRIQVARSDFPDSRLHRVYISWKNFYGYSKDIQVVRTGHPVLVLKRHLQEIGYLDVMLNSEYDASVMDAIKDVQRRYGLAVDGVVGPLTLIALYSETGALEIPLLQKQLKGS